MKSAEKKSLSIKKNKTSLLQKQNKKKDRLAKVKKSVNSQKLINNVELNDQLSSNFLF